MINNNQEYITFSDLKDRGWSESMVKKLIKDPDKTAVNSRYKSAAPIRLYSMERIKELEKTSQFAVLLEVKCIRSKRAAMVANKKIVGAIEMAKNTKIEINMPGTILDILTRAIRHYNNLWTDRGREDKYCDIKVNSLNDLSEKDISFLMRIATNMYRHSMESYTKEVALRFSKVGVHAFHDTLQARINNQINAQLLIKLKETK